MFFNSAWQREPGRALACSRIADQGAHQPTRALKGGAICPRSEAILQELSCSETYQLRPLTTATRTQSTVTFNRLARP